MTWSVERPTKSGYYYVRFADKRTDQVEIMRIAVPDGKDFLACFSTYSGGPLRLTHEYWDGLEWLHVPKAPL